MRGQGWSRILNVDVHFPTLVGWESDLRSVVAHADGHAPIQVVVSQSTVCLYIEVDPCFLDGVGGTVLIHL